MRPAGGSARRAAARASAAPWRLRAAALVLAGTLAVHELRYRIAYGTDAHGQLAAQGHAYLGIVRPLVLAVLVTAAAELLRSLARPRGTEASMPAAGRLWAGASVCLLAIYGGQEWLEGTLAAGHPDGLAGVFGHGGWTAVPLAIAAGALIALALRGSAAAVAGAHGRAPALALARPIAATAVPAPWDGLRPAALARFLAARGPPSASV